ncbi:SDR family oxidoreductase [Sphingomonas xinjiangensis]|uniref:NAD(P)-dependent dehydrogenase (Short-subunit alcohol dehydrogenase family) n=1 Tax=Sphingomonas xinjiangensis TaxID=643568 RepID=A0A840YTF2_9SPHN|nr:SDR family oxidoreductase [Sphingomonas xinjiangensis]MBB5712950.1 NAD(P)-dependent dehydrogenase (short-subunit alcohol dehydrogenase family) [Sphingomonas xinjiangensis]
MTRWTASDIPSQKDRLAVVTGTSGLGYEDARALACAGCEVILAGRDPRKGAIAIDRIRRDVAGAKIGFAQLDLAELSSIRDFADRLAKQRKSVDILINNAGVMIPPQRKTTANGFELQFGTNYLGHFALTAHLLPLLRAGSDPRVISLASVAAPAGAIDFNDLNAEKSYTPMSVYSQSKLACLMFTFELQRRSDAGDWGITSIASHPGIARTDLLHNGPGRWSAHGVARTILPFLFQPAAQGALPTLYAATSPDAAAGGYYGPDRLAETRGFPTAAKVPPQALNKAVAARLWEVSEAMTGVRFASPSLDRRKPHLEEVSSLAAA